MGKHKNKIILTTLGFLIGLLVFASLANIALKLQSQETHPLTVPIVTVASQAVIHYEGEDNTDALTLLKERASIKQNALGMVTTINKREAKDQAKEYWAFYVNGEMATVGAAEYITKEGDRIEWRIETY